MRMNQPQRVAIVTGGGGGVGAATALMLAQRGYHVAITYNRNPAHADAVVQACQAHGVEALAMAVNAIGPFQMARAAAKRMVDGAAIVNVSSLAGETGRGSSYPYVLSKAALNTLTISLARTLAPKIRVNGVMPGMIEGRWMRDGLGEATYQRVKQDFSDLSALGKISQPEDIARAVVWLLEPDAVITGQMLKVDAGFTLGRDRNQSR